MRRKITSQAGIKEKCKKNYNSLYIKIVIAILGIIIIISTVIKIFISCTESFVENLSLSREKNFFGSVHGTYIRW